MRKNISTNTPSEKRVGYSRAVVINNRMYVTGTTSVDENGKTRGKSLREQADYCFEKILKALKEGGFQKEDVVLVRVYVTDMKQLAGFDESFRTYFFDVKPCCTLVGISNLVSPELLIEIECIAEKEV